MTTSHTRWIAITALALALAACTDVGSADIGTGGLYADISVADDQRGDTSTVTVELKVGGGASDTYVELEGDDTLTVTVEDTVVELDKTSFFDAHSYHATLAEAPSDLDYRVALERTLDDGAPDTRVQLPPAFDLTVDAGQISRGADDLVVAWTAPSTDPMRLTVDGDCIEAEAFDLDGTAGSHTVPAGTLVDDPSDTSGSCDLQLTLSRTRLGALDPAFGEGGSAVGVRRRVVVVPSMR